jgi:opacity protein-like surface antigen
MFSTMTMDWGGSSSSVDIALVTEAGVRYMALKNVSLDAAFRYRYAAPNYNFPYPAGSLDLSHDSHQFSALFRVSYHF